MTAKCVKKLNWTTYQDPLINYIYKENVLEQKLYVISIYDHKFDYYHRPFLTDDVSSATRSFYDACLSDKSHMSENPNQYSMKMLGSITSNGPEVVFEQFEDTLITGSQVLQLKDQEDSKNVS